MLATAIKFSLKTNMIKKSGKHVTHEDVAYLKPGPPTFNEADKENKATEESLPHVEKRPVDLSELQAAIDGGQSIEEIMKIVDKIVHDRDSLIVKPNSNLEMDVEPRNKAVLNRLIQQRRTPEGSKQIETPDFNYRMFENDINLLGVAPRDFKA